MASLICVNMINKWLLALLFTRLNSLTLPNLGTKLPKLAPSALINSLLILKLSETLIFVGYPQIFQRLPFLIFYSFKVLKACRLLILKANPAAMTTFTYHLDYVYLPP